LNHGTGSEPGLLSKTRGESTELTPVFLKTGPLQDELFITANSCIKKSGRTVGDFDLIIASTAITIEYSVVTNKQRHFDKIPGLDTLNWKKDIS